SGRIAACWYSFTNYTIDVNFTDGKMHQVALYLLDWDSTTRNERVEVIDPYSVDHPLLDTREVSSFSGGVYLVWHLSGYTQIKITNIGSPYTNAVASALFFDSGTPRISQMAYDWRDRLIATNEGAEPDDSMESDSVNRPIDYVELNNLGETIDSEQFDGDG